MLVEAHFGLIKFRQETKNTRPAVMDPDSYDHAPFEVTDVRGFQYAAAHLNDQQRTTVAPTEKQLLSKRTIICLVINRCVGKDAQPDNAGF